MVGKHQDKKTATITRIGSLLKHPVQNNICLRFFPFHLSPYHNAWKWFNIFARNSEDYGDMDSSSAIVTMLPAEAMVLSLNALLVSSMNGNFSQ